MEPESQENVATFVLLAYLFTALVWVLEGAVLMIQFFTPRRLDPAAHTILITTCVALTLVVRIFARPHFEQLRPTGGKVPMTWMQGLVATAMVLSMGAFMGWILLKLANP